VEKIYRIGPETTLGEFARFAVDYKISLRPMAGGHVEMTSHERMGCQGPLLEALHRIVTKLHVAAVPVIPELDDRQEEIVFEPNPVTCHLPLVSLDKTDPCPRCRNLAGQHRNHPSNRTIPA
jgi:hypothetical protein